MTLHIDTQSRSDGGSEKNFQQRVQPWLMACFGEMIAGDREERNHRFLEEALELVQACGCTASEAHQLVDYVYGRPVGELHQEVGGVMVTLAALCLANDADMHAAGWVELDRIWGKVEAIRAKQAAKPKHSPLPAHPPADAAAVAGEVRAYLDQLGAAKHYDVGDGTPHPMSIVERIASIAKPTPTTPDTIGSHYGNGGRFDPGDDGLRALLDRAELAWQRFFYPARDCFIGDTPDLKPAVGLETADCLRLTLAALGRNVSDPNSGPIPAPAEPVGMQLVLRAARELVEAYDDPDGPAFVKLNALRAALSTLTRTDEASTDGEAKR